ncbi:MAG: Isoleucine-tRNA ligase [Parcubacteria group bacterium GW2011_GWA2_47_8]|nr:MAG: Isoleucine-tRNA ligase [Parcubacteria group bacterium GW2011_GWA2_47_8]
MLYYALESFVVEMSRLREEMIAANQQIMWVPEHIKEGRFGEWLNEVKDWNFSRNRYWGTPLPIWVDEKTGAMKVIESFAELKQYADNFDEVYGGAAGAKAGAGVSDVSGFDPHRPFIDQITISCDEGKHMKRVPYVADVWFDSGSMPFAQYHYPFENGEMVDGAGAATSPGAQYPADYICEGMDQTRGWFYTLHAVAAVLGRAPSFKGCISHGLVLDENGKKMSKSLGNVVDPWKQIEQYGADAIRWFFYTVNAPGESKLYAEKELRARQQRFLSTWLNSLTFLQLYGTKDGYQADAIFEKADSSLDRWIVSRFHSTIEIVIRSLDILDVVVAARSIETFVDDLSNWWLRRSRDAIKNPKTKKAKSSLLYSLLLELTKLAAPFVPFTAEYVYQELKAFSDDRALAESVHMDRYPMGIKKYINHDLEHKMCMIRMASSVILQKRAVEGIKIRQPLTKVTLKVPQDLNIDVEDQILISDEVNIKSVEIEHNDTGKEDASIEVVNLDTVLTDELINEAADRERIRAVQEKRKNLQLQPSELANLKLEIPKDKKEFQALMSQIKNIGVATCTTASLVPLSELGPDAESIILHSGVQHFVLTKRGIKKLTK